MTPERDPGACCRPRTRSRLADWLAANGHPCGGARSSISATCATIPVGALAAEAHLGAGLVQLHALNQPTAAYQHLVEVLDLDPEPDTAAYARQALAEIAALQKFRR